MNCIKVLSFLFGLLISTSVYADRQDSGSNRKSTYQTIYLDQHWTETERDRFYNTPQGSYLIPYRWFVAMTTTGEHRLFNNKWNIRRYGYLVEDKKSFSNPDNLPVGFAKEPVENGDPWLGYSCAACHTNDIHYQGNSVRIDGAPALADFTAFVDGLIGALQSTLQGEARFDRFTGSVLGKDVDLSQKVILRDQVYNHLAWLKGFAKRSRPNHAFGAGRVDAFGVIMNEVFGFDLGQTENIRNPNAPVSYPFLWGTPQHDFVQWTGSAFNPFGRNVGEVLGTFGHVNLDIKSPAFGSTTARARELFELEGLVAKLVAPRWPEKLLGSIDEASVARGRVLYTQARQDEESCADCHALKDNNGRYPATPRDENLFGVPFVKTHMTALDEIGTDPLTAKNFALRTVNTGAVAPFLPPPFTNKSVLPAPVMLSILVGIAAKDSNLHALPPFNAAESAELIGYRQKAAGLPPYTPPNLLAYRARPLDGIWATAPYLHNGSVPNLYELLLPPKERSKVFYVGDREFDPAKIGFKSRRNRYGFRFDTRIPGNFNSGHLYGTDLNEAQRHDLLEFLKTL